MKVSVVMTTYSGDKYIVKQLDSIRDQTYKPDEVIIADDKSLDGTFEVVSSYIKNNHLEKWTVYQNQENLGVIMNFFQAMKKTTGDFVFLSDQDDIWEPSKIEEMLKIIGNRDEILILMSKENRIDENDEYIQFTDKETRDVRRISLAEEVRECLGAGHLIVIRKSFMDMNIDALMKSGLTFDVPFCIAAAAMSGLYQYDKRLVKRRIHGNNTSGIQKKCFSQIKDYERYVKGRLIRIEYFEFLINNWNEIVNSENSVEFEELIKAVGILKKSAEGLKKHKLGPLLAELFSRNKYLNKNISLANIMALIITSVS